MNEKTFDFEVTLKVSVEAYSEDDAADLLQDTFGLGEDCGVTILEFNAKSL